jgi:hypothetical protein
MCRRSDFLANKYFLRSLFVVTTKQGQQKENGGNTCHVGSIKTQFDLCDILMIT